MRLVPSAALALAAAAVLSACSTARDVQQSSSTGDCTRCHGFPPEQISGSGLPHPSNTNCVVCHAATVTTDNEIIEGGAHMNGHVDVTGGHEMPYVGQHTTAALADIASCTSCHGADYGGGGSAPGAPPSCNACHEEQLGFADWKTNCTFCHGTRTAGLSDAPGALAAPPQTVAGTDGQTRANPKVGAHQKHLVAGTYSAPLACGSCHAVPAQTFPESLEHLDGSAVVQFSAMAQQGVTSPGYTGGSCAVYCHGSTSLLSGGTNKTPAWTSTGGVVCGSCHTLSPTSGYHEYHLTRGVPCASCHPGYAIAPDPEQVNTTTHVNGTFEASPINAGGATFSSWPSSCSDCH
jgi:predicted CxxxxCH...CXXCH cytochrome family protein